MIVPVIISGGSGHRLWPVSREGHPKPFMKLADGESLLAKTYRRAVAVIESCCTVDSEIITVTNRDHYFLSKDQLLAADPKKQVASTFLLEPEGRNTAPAILMAAHFIAEKYGSDAVMLVMPADHLIQNQHHFAGTVKDAAILAEQGHLVTFGIVPTSPETGFGYIEAGEGLSKGRKALRFVEKPSFEKAQAYVESGDFYWNSGMFCFQAGQVLKEMQRHSGDLFVAAQNCWQALMAQSCVSTPMQEFPHKEFAQLPNISIDYALMERSDNVAVIPSDFGWSDIGSWSAIKDLVQPDSDNNRALGEVIFVDSQNTFVQSEDRLVATVGVDNLMIIDTTDALLVANPDKSEAVKQVVLQLKSQGHEAHRLHRTVMRPWGTYTVIEEGAGFKIKRIEVKPGASLSLQMHHHRNEHWIVVSGMAKVINGEQEILLGTNQSTYIPAGHKHRLENPGLLDLVMIEVQSGQYLGEDDIVRFEDNYGRA
ncbi:MAG: mannose-1-phosphate guanylyltransferase/mannose-6-phosphate isomerase [Alphaproteobacteria bacterium]|nr:mannose-1-phosphate guanylyltransferase/mannose-6-phosphate isomerase [Alphaproteobacteria bacterium]